MQNHAYIQLIAKKYFPLSTKSNQLPKTDFKHGAQCKHPLKKGEVKFFPCFFFCNAQRKDFKRDTSYVVSMGSSCVYPRVLEWQHNLEIDERFRKTTTSNTFSWKVGKIKSLSSCNIFSLTVKNHFLHKLLKKDCLKH